MNGLIEDLKRDYERKIKYLLEIDYWLAPVDRSELDKHFEMVDRKMALVKVGSPVYEAVVDDDSFYLQLITKIIDKEMGTVEVFEPGINRKRTCCITSCYLCMKRDESNLEEDVKSMNAYQQKLDDATTPDGFTVEKCTICGREFFVPEVDAKTMESTAFVCNDCAAAQAAADLKSDPATDDALKKALGN